VPGSTPHLPPGISRPAPAPISTNAGPPHRPKPKIRLSIVTASKNMITGLSSTSGTTIDHTAQFGRLLIGEGPASGALVIFRVRG
jgi:hypothetical protein